jgi:hypothetical protein
LYFPIQVAVGSVVKRLPKQHSLPKLLEAIGRAFKVPSGSLVLTYKDGEDLNC